MRFPLDGIVLFDHFVSRRSLVFSLVLRWPWMARVSYQLGRLHRRIFFRLISWHRKLCFLGYGRLGSWRHLRLRLRCRWIQHMMGWFYYPNRWWWFRLCYFARYRRKRRWFRDRFRLRICLGLWVFLFIQPFLDILVFFFVFSKWWYF